MKNLRWLESPPQIPAIPAINSGARVQNVFWKQSSRVPLCSREGLKGSGSLWAAKAIRAEPQRILFAAIKYFRIEQVIFCLDLEQYDAFRHNLPDFERGLRHLLHKQGGAVYVEGVARLCGKLDRASELLAPVYGCITESPNTMDLKQGKALLDELAGRLLADTGPDADLG